MKVTNKIDIHLDDYQIIPEIVVMQCDTNTRELQFTLYENKQAWTVPSDADIYVSYRKPDGTGGLYDTFPDGTAACSVSDNTISAILTDQVLTCPGKVPVAISIQLDSAVLTTFAVWLKVMPNPGVGAMESEDYFCLKAAVAAAVAAAKKPVHLITVSRTESGGYRADYSVDVIQQMLQAKLPVVCYWEEKAITAYLVGPCAVPFVFLAIRDGVEYRITIGNTGVDCTVTKLARATEIPTRNSELENDSGYLTAAPVTSINGRTGDITLPTAVKVTVTQQSDGTYAADLSCAKILEVHNAGNMVYCQYGTRVLPLLVASKLFCAFGCVYSGSVHTVTVSSAAVTVNVTPLASGGSGGSGGLSIWDDGEGNVTIDTAAAVTGETTQ